MICAQPGCPEIAVNGNRCDEHRKARHREARIGQPRQSQPAAWRRKSQAIRAARPVCECSDPDCGVCHGQCSRPSAHADHIIDRVYFDDPEARDHESNVQALCAPCHSSKTVRTRVHQPTDPPGVGYPR